MSRLVSYLLVVAVVCLVSAGSLAAQEADAKKKKGSKGGNLQERFKKLDTDGDGFLSVEEFAAGNKRLGAAKLVEAVFKAKDTDGDKKLTPDELRVTSAEETMLSLFQAKAVMEGKGLYCEGCELPLNECICHGEGEDDG